MNSHNAFFICGSDTDVGKTVVCTGILRNIPNAQVLKVIQTGEQGLDQQTYLSAVANANVSTLFHFPLPASPHLAAAQIGDDLSLSAICQRIQQKIANQAMTLIECSGGLMTPLNEHETFIDLMRQFDYPVLLVVKNTLGAINQALCSIELLQRNGIDILGLVLSETAKTKSDNDKLINQENYQFLARKCNLPIIVNLAFIEGLADEPLKWLQIETQLADIAHQVTLKNNDTDLETEQLAFDREHLWHPYEYAQTQLSRPKVTSAIGAYLTLSTGQRVIDGMSSWWSVIHGYSHPKLVKAAQIQCARLSHVMFGGLTHDPAIELGQKLRQIVPDNLTQIFYADSGSVSVEVALKMAQQYWQGVNKPQKSKIISFYGAYHGDTYGAMSVTDPINGMHTLFQDTLANNIFAPRPESSFYQTFDPSTLEPLRDLFEKHHHECAALIIEPIVQGAGGMWFYHPDYLAEIRALCDQYQLLLIVDEIATGFGRTGKLFASEWANIQPDIMCIGKSLTGGMLTLSATLTTEKVATGISTTGMPLMHGPTYMANPLACQVAVASLDLLMTSNWQQRVEKISQWLWLGLKNCLDYPGVKDVRVLGAIGVVELTSRVNTQLLTQYFLKQGVWIRPFNKLIYIMPPFIASFEEIASLTHAVYQAVKDKAWE